MIAEERIAQFWNTHPCGENLVARRAGEYDEYFTRYDAHRYALERHILRCLDRIDVHGRATLEIGLG
ncbi:MAG TPA: hypothetical protein VHN14_17880, partial [Kofleriaceae bacterium]|nr:hypothetical protein [Kofleriaceae bacterium]